MSRESLYVQFLNSTVAIESGDPSLVSWYRRRFRHMLVDEPRNPSDAAAAAAATTPIETLTITKRPSGEHVVEQASTGERRHGSAGEMIRDVEYSVVDAMIAAHPKLFWLHSGAAAYEGKAVVVAGVAGRGKSTLIGGLVRSGWLFLSDDAIALDLEADVAYPFPRTPVARRPVGRPVPENLLYELEKEEIVLEEGNVATEPVPLAALVFPFFEFEGETELSVYPKGPAATDLLRNCFSFTARGAEALDQLHDLVSRLPTLRIAYQKGEDAAALVMKARQNDFELG